MTQHKEKQNNQQNDTFFLHSVACLGHRKLTGTDNKDKIDILES